MKKSNWFYVLMAILFPTILVVAFVGLIIVCCVRALLRLENDSSDYVITVFSENAALHG